ncbi:MAG: AgmX/PglI C-terminal domain-containing protein [Byssovorax sp.]
MTTQKSNKVSPLNVNPFLPSRPFDVLANPFTMPSPFTARAEDVPADAPEGSYTYKLVQSGPEVASEECELATSAVEIMIRWGTTVLHVAHLTPPRSFFVGERQEKGAACDFQLPAEKLGADRLPLVLASGEGNVRLVIPAGATGTITLAGGAAQTVAAVLASGKAQPSSEAPSAFELPLPSGSKAEIELGGLSFAIGTVNAGRAVAGRFSLDANSLPYQGLSLLLHAGLLAATALFMPSMAMASDDDMSDDQKYMLATRLEQVAEREQDKKEELTADSTHEGATGGTGAQAMGESGAMGSTTSHNTNARWGAKGDKNNPEVQLSRSAALREAAEFGMIGLLNNGGGGDPNAPTVPWGGLVTNGNDARSALGNMWGANLDEAGGAGGLGLTGVGEGGGGQFEGIGLGRIGTYGHGEGLGDGQDFGFGRSKGILRGTHQTKSPGMVRVGNATVGGHLPPEVIQRIVRQNFGRFKLCYENGLRNNPNLQGRVAVNFVIGHDGAISQAQNGGSDLPDGGVVSCVVRAFYGLSFPAPDSGIVTVSYPIVFTPAS